MSEIISDQRFKNVELSGEVGLRLTAATGTIKHSGSGNLTIKTTNKKLILHANNSSDGALEFIGPNGNIIMNSSGITIGSSDTIVTMASSTNVFNNDVSILGNLTVTGNTVAHNVQTYTVDDSIIGLANGQTSPSYDIGFVGFRGNDNEKVAFIWDESLDRFAAVGTYTNNSTTLNINSYKDLCVKDLISENLTGTLQSPSQTNITSVGTLSSLAVDNNFNIVNHNGSYGLHLAGSLVTSTSEELNYLSGITTGLASPNKALVADLNKDLNLNGGDLTTTNINISGTISIKGVTYTYPTSDGSLNQVLKTDSNGNLSWFTPPSNLSSLSDISITDPILNNIIKYNGEVWINSDSINLDNIITSSLSVSSITLGGTSITASATELNKLDGVTSSTTELNYVDLDVLGTVEASKALVVDLSKNLTGLNNLSMATLTATGVVLNGNLDLSSGNRDILINDNSSTALEIKEGSNTYLTFDTTNTTEKIILGKSIDANSNNITGVNTLSVSSITLGGISITASATELNKLDGVTSSTSELNILTGITSSTSELNILTGVTSSTSELNILTGVTASATELNYVDLDVLGTVEASKALVVDLSKNLTGLNNLSMAALTATGVVLNGNLDLSSGNRDILINDNSSTALEIKEGSNTYLTFDTTNTAEKIILGKSIDANSNNVTGVNTLSVSSITLGGISITASATELNKLDGVTSSTLELNILTGVTSSTSELNILTGVTASATELNYVDLDVLGVVEPSKALVVDLSKNLTGLNNLSMATLTATGVVLNGNLDLSSGNRDILINDNSSTALEIKEGSNTYLTFDTTNTTEKIILGKSIDANSNNVTGVNTLGVSSITLGGTSITASATELNYVDLDVLGTVEASKALVVDASKNLTGLNNLSMATLTATGVVLNGNLDLSSGDRDILINDNSSTALEIKEGSNTYLTFDTTNTTEKIILGKSIDANSNNITGVNTLGVSSITLGSISITASATELNYVDVSVLGTAEASKALVVDALKNITDINSLSATSLSGTLSTATQPNITSLSSSVTIIGQTSSGGKLILRESTDQGTNQITIKAPATLSSNYTLRLPVDDGNSNNFLKTDGSGILSWDYPIYFGVVSDIKSSTVDGGTSTSGIWHTRSLNTKSENTTFITLSSNRITLDSGTYHVSASAPCYNGNQHQLKLVNITGNTTAILGQCAYSASLYNVQNSATLDGLISPVTSTTYELQHYITNGVVGDGLGRSVSSGESEVYSVVKIYKLS